MSKKMREEFEAWFKSFADIDVLFDNNDQAFAINQPLTHGDKIVNTVVDSSWKSWKASRAALCVEIPTSGEASSFGNYVVFDSDAVREMLDAAGVSYK